MTPQEYGKAPYARIVVPDEAGGFYAEVLEFPGCFAQGETVGEAFKNLESAAQSWITVALANGQEIPEPSSNLDFGGKVALRLPRSLHRQATRLAERDGTSLNQFLVTAIASRVGSEDFYLRLLNRLESRLSATAANYRTQMAINSIEGTIAQRTKTFDIEPNFALPADAAERKMLTGASNV